MDIDNELLFLQNRLSIKLFRPATSRLLGNTSLTQLELPNPLECCQFSPYARRAATTGEGSRTPSYILAADRRQRRWCIWLARCITLDGKIENCYHIDKVVAAYKLLKILAYKLYKIYGGNINPYLNRNKTT